MATIVTRAGKGSPLTHTEVDTNFTNLNTNKLETAAIPLGTLAAPSISFLSDANTGIYSPGADTLAFVTAGSNRVHITSAGLVGIGTTAPGGKLTVVTTTHTPGNSFGSFTDSYLMVSTGTSNTSSGLGFGYDSTNDHGLILSVSPSVAWRPIRYIAGDHRFEITGGIEKARLDASGRLLVGTVTGNANGGILQLSGGITFPATAVAASDANTLDDYEEGTWTPTYYGSTTAGTTTYTSQEGQYTKIGRTVTVHAQISISAATGTGEVYFGGLPFAIDPAFFYCVGTVAVSGVNWGGGTYLVLLSGGTTTAQPVYLSDDAVFANQAVVNESQVWRFTYSYNV